MFVVWLLMVLITSRVLKHGLGFMMRALLPQAVVALATSSSMATLPATRVACDQLGADADESTPFYTVGAAHQLSLSKSFWAAKAYRLILRPMSRALSLPLIR